MAVSSLLQALAVLIQG